MKLVVDEPESAALEQHLSGGMACATSRIALVEVSRAVKLANPAEDALRDAERLLESCLLIDVSRDLLRSAVTLTSKSLRTLDAIHLASALHVGADEMLAYDLRLLRAATEHGLTVEHPGLE